jgi:NADH-quinone oxidoreductase subunit L
VAHEAERTDAWTWWISHYAYWAVLLGVFVTAFYSFRLLYLTFHGKERFHDPVPDHYVAPEADSTEHEEALAHEHDAVPGADGHDDDHGHHGAHVPHESPWVVTIPLILLAIPSLVIGMLTIGPMLAGNFFDGSIEIAPHHDAMAAFGKEYAHLAHEMGLPGMVAFALHGMIQPPFLLALAGFLLATAMYLWPWPDAHHAARRMFAPIVRILENKYGFDDLWIGGFARGGVGLGRFASRRGDAGLIDGIVDGTAWLIDRAASLLRHLQSGYLYHYAFAMILGLIALLAVLVERA